MSQCGFPRSQSSLSSSLFAALALFTCPSPCPLPCLPFSSLHHPSASVYPLPLLFCCIFQTMADAALRFVVVVEHLGGKGGKGLYSKSEHRSWIELLLRYISVGTVSRRGRTLFSGCLFFFFFLFLEDESKGSIVKTQTGFRFGGVYMQGKESFAVNLV